MRALVRSSVGFVLAVGASVATAGAGPESAPPRPGSREEARLELGRRLFFDPAASRLGMRSCADCHDPRHGYSDPSPVSHDDRVATRRHSQTLIDGADNPSAHWDGAFRRVEDLVTARLTQSARGRVSSGHELPGGSALKGSDGGGDGPAPRDSGVASGTSPARTGGGASDSGGGRSGGSPAPSPAPGDAPQDPEEAGSGSSSGGGSGGSSPGYGGAFRAPSSAGGDEKEGPSDGAPSAPTTPGDAPTAPAPAPTSPSSGAPPGGDGGKSPANGGGDRAPAGPGARPSASGSDPYAPDAGDEAELEPAFFAPTADVSKTPAADRVLADAGRYREAFEAAYGSPTITIAKIAEAIAAYCHSIRSGTSAYDRHAAGDPQALPPSAKRGLELFRGRAGCASCHVLGKPGERAPFTDYANHVTGVSWAGLSASDDAARAAIAAADADRGAGDVTGRPKEHRAFKTPTLRDVASRAPYMHDASLSNLANVVRYYASPPRDPNLDPRLTGFAASRGEIADLVAFLRSLSSDVRPGLATTSWRARAKTTTVTLVDAKGKPLAGQRFLVAPAGDVLPGGREGLPGIERTTDADGTASWTPLPTTHARIVLPDGLRTAGGSLIPDSCREARVQVFTDGRAGLFVTFPKGRVAPETLLGDHEGATVFPDRRLPRTVFRRDALLELDDGRTTALYRASVRTDAPPVVALRLPWKVWGVDRLRIGVVAGERGSLDLSR